MPSVIVLALGSDSSVSSVADAVAAGAQSVRFTDVTVRASKPDVFRYPVVVPDTLAAYDGVVFVASGGVVLPAALTWNAGRLLVNTVLGQIGGDATLRLALVDAGGIVVSVPTDNASNVEAQALGVRVAKVAGWVRHALGHESESHAAHDHGRHDHHDHASHGHHPS